MRLIIHDLHDLHDLHYLLTLPVLPDLHDLPDQLTPPELPAPPDKHNLPYLHDLHDLHALPAFDIDAPPDCGDGPKTRIITDNGAIKHCIGCFGCWVKTPGKCVLNDQYSEMGALMGCCTELTIISECVYGGFSPFVKNVLDRSISYISPHFATRNGEMHHKRRYDNVINITVHMYGGDITASERETAINLIAANALNFGATIGDINFYATATEAKEALI